MSLKGRFAVSEVSNEPIQTTESNTTPESGLGSDSVSTGAAPTASTTSSAKTAPKQPTTAGAPVSAAAARQARNTPTIHPPPPVSFSSTNQYATCLGPSANYVKLVACDGHEFFMRRECAYVSGTIRHMLTQPGEYEQGEVVEISFRSISSKIMAIVTQYMKYKFHYSQCEYDIINLPIFQVPEEHAKEILMAANLLDC